MSTYKSYTPRRPVDSTNVPSNDKLKEKVEKLQELFPNWSYEDLQSVLTETGGDVELAVARISEGHAEQWGSVTRKKEKKVSQPPQSTSTFSARGDRDRPSGDFRGGRGGRGGRGRGAGGRGASRAAHSSHQHRDNGASAVATNGTTVAPAAVSTPVAETANTADSYDPHAEGKTNGVSDGINVSTDESQASAGDNITQGGSDAPILSLSAGKTTDHLTDAKSSTHVQYSASEAAKIRTQAKTSTIPPGAKRSWAQIARPNEKPKPTVSLAPPTAPTEVAQATEETAAAHDHQDIEEPTTVQPPTFDDEPPTQPPQAPEPQISTTHDGWITSENIAPPPTTLQEQWESPADAATEDSSWKPPQPEESIADSSPQTATPSLASLAPISSTASATTSTAPTSKPSTPSVTSARPTNAHRTSARYPKSDQAVVIPAFAGSIGTSGEKLGMQFGSLSIGGDDNFDGTFKHDTEPTATSTPEQPSAAQSQPTQATPQTQSHEVVQSPVVQVPAHNQSFFQQAQPATSTPAQTQSIQSPQPVQQPATSGPPFGSHPPPPALTHQQQQQQLAQHHQAQQHTYGQQQQQQHGIHAHFDGPPVAQQQQPQAQHASAPQTGSYFRQPESPYYHNPTPPQNAPTEHQGAYGTTFSPLGVGAGAHAHAQSLGAQAQGTHLGGFGAGGPGEYGYSDGQRGFYDYTQPSGFGRSLVHDEPKGGLPLSQGTQPSSSLASTTGQPQSSSGPQGSAAPANQQAQQQGYPAPIPYYYPPYYPQNTYPTYPNPSYGQAYMPKYPPVYPHQAPVGPGSAPPPTAKGPNANAPYNTSASQSHLYHGQGGFEDPNANYQHHQASTNLGTADYQKQGPHHQQQQQQPLYGSQGTQGLQSFLGIQQAGNAGQGVGGPGSQQRSTTSPETTYKPYGAPGGASDKSGVGIGTQPGQQGRGAGVQQSQQQAGGAGSFYPGGRFSAGGPQQQGQQQSQGYPQSGDQGQFYPYQPRHQGGYWQ